VSDSQWTRVQIVQLAVWIESHPHRWPFSRITVALRAIAAGERDWMGRTAEVQEVA
jgi:hypothetical protein